MNARVTDPIRNLARRSRWRFAVRGMLPGTHPGRRLGSAGEFEGYRAYQPGDDVARLDARVFARHRQRMVRLLREDSVVPVTVLVDSSASMQGPERQSLLLDLVRLFFEMCQHRQDPFRVFSFGDGRIERAPAATALAWDALRTWLEERSPTGASRFERELRQLPPDPAGRGVVVVISDAMGIESAARDLAGVVRVGTPLWIAPLLPEELAPPLGGNCTLRSRESQEQWRGILDDTTRREYRAQLERYHGSLHRWFRAQGGDFVVVPTDESIVHAVERIRREGKLLQC